MASTGSPAVISLPIVLVKSSDWDKWFSSIKSEAEAVDIWQFVDPSRPEQPQLLLKPILVEDDKDDVQWQREFRRHELRSKEYEQQLGRLANLKRIIIYSLATQNHVY